MDPACDRVVARTNHWEPVMCNIVLWMSALAAIFAPLFHSAADRSEKRPATPLTLKSRYSGEIIADGARRVTLTVTLDDKGEGSGTLSFDPNTYDAHGATQIAIHHVQVRLHQVKDAAHAAKGRRLYEIKREGRDEWLPTCGEVIVPARWFLVLPEKKDNTSWLVLTDTAGKFQDIIVME
jgi:hypothetical protein